MRAREQETARQYTSQTSIAGHADRTHYNAVWLSIYQDDVFSVFIISTLTDRTLTSWLVSVRISLTQSFPFLLKVSFTSMHASSLQNRRKTPILRSLRLPTTPSPYLDTKDVSFLIIFFSWRLPNQILLYRILKSANGWIPI